MKFFTDQRWWPYLLINIKKYRKMRKFKRFKEILIDPGVFDLKISSIYSWEGSINIKEFLDSLPENHFFSYDYPSDMNLYWENRFIEKSWENAKRYHNYPQYITTIQGKFNNYFNYIEWFHKYNDLETDFMGLGNMCQHRTLNKFLKHTLPYIFKYSNAKRIHIYGLCKRGIPFAAKMAKLYKKELSIDQEKWQYFLPSKLRPILLCNYLNDILKEIFF